MTDTDSNWNDYIKHGEHKLDDVDMDKVNMATDSYETVVEELHVTASIRRY